jgi:hypothetical protein
MWPSFVATSMFYYEWTLHSAETILLIFALVCLVMGVVFGTMIVRSTGGTEEKSKKNKENESKNSPTETNGPATQTVPVEVHLKVRVEQEHSASTELPASKVELTDQLTISTSPKSEQSEYEPQLATVIPLPEQEVQVVDEVPAVNSDLSKLFGQLSDIAVAGASHKEEHACPSDRWTVPAKQESVPAASQDNRTVEQLLNSADALIAQGNYDDAIKLYDHVVKVDANNFDAWFLKAVALRKKQRSQDSIYCINFALSIKRTSVVAMVEKGECLLQLDRADQAIIWFDKALSQDKIAIAPWIGKARCLVKMGEINSAIACYDKVLSLQPDHTEAIAARAELSDKAPGGKKSKAVS